MKKLTLFLFLSMVIIFSAEAHRYKKAQVTISIQTFYDQLSPYGDWIYSPDYGYVWRPYFDNPASFRPYSSNGNWVYTDYGWTWASGYDWGWATFHYGRWDFDNYLGWLWIPGTEWAPAWVSWGSYDNYWGWAPMGPNIYVQSNWYAPDTWWTFVPQNQFCSGNWNRYIYDRPVQVNHITHITNVYVDASNRNNHNTWYNGPRLNDVERYSTTKIRRMKVGESQRPERSGIHNNRLDVYRPAVDNNRNVNRPSEYRNVEQVRSGKRMEQTNARTNDPGMNRTRDNRPETRTITPKPVQRNDNSSRETKVDSRTSTQSPNIRTTEAPGNSNSTNRPYTQPEPRNSSVNTQTPVELQNRPQTSPERNSKPPSMEAQKGVPDRRNTSNVTEGNRPVGNSNRVINTDNRQIPNSAPARENVNNNSARESGNSQVNVAQPTREQKNQNVSTPSTSRTNNTERQQTTKEEVKKSAKESRRSVESTENRSSENPNRR